MPRLPADRSVIGEALVVAVAPIATWAVLRFPLINQDNFIDPWFYTGYGQMFQSMYAHFGWPYYATRFSVIALNEAASLVPPEIGYAILRYLLVLACGVPLYLWARASFGRGVALLGYLFLFWNPLLPRIVLWDVTTFVSVPFALAGMALWLLTDRAAPRFLAGFAWMMSIAAHAFTGTAIGTFVIVQAVWRLRRGEFGRLLLRDVLLPAAGAAACLILGLLYYRWRIGAFDPTVLLTVTLQAIAAGNEYALTHRTPAATWMLREYNVFVPPLCVIVGAVVLRGRLLETTGVSSIWWFGAAYTLVYAVYQFVFGRFVLETFYYFGHLTVVVFLLIPVILSALVGTAPGRTRVLAASAGALVLIPLLNRLDPARVRSILDASLQNPMAAVVLSAAGLFVLGSTGWLLIRGRGGAAAAASFVLLAQAFTFLSPEHQYTFDMRHVERERNVYGAATAMLKVFAAYSRPEAPIRLWYCSRDSSLGSVASSVQLLTLHQPFDANGPSCDSRVGEHERRNLLNPPAYLMMLDRTGSSFASRDATLRAEGFSVQEVASQTIGGRVFHARLRLVRLTRVSDPADTTGAAAARWQLVVDWKNDDVRHAGGVMTYSDETAERLTRDTDGYWTFIPMTRQEHFATRWIQVPAEDPVRLLLVEATPSPRATANCLLGVQNQRFEDIAHVRCHANGQTDVVAPVVRLAADVTLIRLYLVGAPHRPIVLPQRITIRRRLPSEPPTQ